MALASECLFLLEVLIDKITYVKHPCTSERNYTTCVSFSFTNADTFEICDDDIPMDLPKGDPFVTYFNSGKSCLFPLKDDEIKQAINKCLLKVAIRKTITTQCVPTQMDIGESIIDMTKEFTQARKMQLEDSSCISGQALQDTFRITAADGSEVGEITMFLRISCCGKDIVTQFQSGQNVTSKRGDDIVDRSCIPKKEFISQNSPCGCGTMESFKNITIKDSDSRAISVGFDDPCYCSGPKPKPKDTLVCRNTDQYCLHIPKGSTLKPTILESSLGQTIESPKVEFQNTCQPNVTVLKNNEVMLNNVECGEQGILSIKKLIQYYFRKINLSIHTCISMLSPIVEEINKTQISSIQTLSDLHRKDVQEAGSILNFNESVGFRSHIKNNIFSNSVFLVYTLYDSRQRIDSSTQATGSMNKCLQVSCSKNNNAQSLDIKFAATACLNPSEFTISTISTSTHESIHEHYMNSANNCPEIYFFGSKKCSNKCPTTKSGSSTSSQTKIKKCGGFCSKRNKNNVASAQVMSTTTTGQQTNDKPCCSPATCSATNTGKSVSIKDALRCPKGKPCPFKVERDLSATVSHIKLGPKIVCPIHGAQCQAPTSAEDKAAVKMSNVNNPRRGVFELVIRRLNGAPLAKNELMLEWTPPLTKCAASCGGAPCVIPIPCRSKCKVVLCRPKCKPKLTRRRSSCSSCRKPCSRCCSPCRKPCWRCCQPKKSPCSPCAIPCNIPCNFPCYKPCPIGRKICRPCCSQPKIKPRSRQVSPCRNRSYTCGVVRCRSLPGPCVSPPCCPRVSCSVVPCTPPPRCSKSRCSTCCIRPC